MERVQDRSDQPSLQKAKQIIHITTSDRWLEGMCFSIVIAASLGGVLTFISRIYE